MRRNDKDKISEVKLIVWTNFKMLEQNNQK
jgi:hypothetical protein